jgi:LacI family transcriptional regulator
MKRANRTDVARLAGVSAAVVSYVINNGPRPVASATKSRVIAAMAELNYRPNANARALKLARTGVIGLLIRDITNPYFSELAQKVQERAHESGYGLMIGNAGREGVEETAEFQNMLAREVDGIAVYGIRRPETLAAISASGVKVVSLDWHLESSVIPSVGIDDYGAGRDAVEHLLGHGYKEIGLIAARESQDLREKAWTDAMAATQDRSHLSQLREYSDFTLQGGYEAALKLIQQPAPPRAIFASSDVQAFGAIRAIQYLGLRIPDDIAVISVDGTDASAFTYPSLTAVQLPFQKIADYIVDELTSPEAPKARNVFSHTLARRESCGCVRFRTDTSPLRSSEGRPG